MARTVEDAALIFGLIAGADPADPTASTEPVPDYVAGLSRGAKGLRIGVPTRFFTDCDDDTRRLLADVERVFASLGALVVKFDPPDI
ncbi:MAG: amidase family protein [Actinomycetota bacterium]